MGTRAIALLLAGALAGTGAHADKQIEQVIRWKLARSAALSKDRFTVRVEAGVAILEGRTRVVQRKGAATRIAKGAGAVRVDNRIVVVFTGEQTGSPLPPKRKARVVRPKPQVH